MYTTRMTDKYELTWIISEISVISLYISVDYNNYKSIIERKRLIAENVKNNLLFGVGGGR